MIKSTIQKIYLSLILILLYAPILTLIVLSFNKSKSRSSWGGFSLDWYNSLFKNETIMNALYTTLMIALVSALVATIIGTAAAIGIQALGAKTRTTMMTITNIPMLNADIVTGISLMLLFIACRFTLGFTTVLLAHITFNIPYVILSVMPKLKQTNKYTYEAALDLGASPIYAFFKVVMPDIFPGICSGFLLAFTMSLDDFVITHFTKGAGVDTLSTKIYSEVRKGIKPEMYALSTLLFVSVLFLLILVNTAPQETTGSKAKKPQKQPSIIRKASNIFFRRIVPVTMILTIIAGGIFYKVKNKSASGEKLVIYNWGEYIDPEVLEIFEKETGITVIYDEFETNESMYTKVESGAIAYDLVCPSDYMIQRMIQHDLLAEINWNNIPNAQNLDPQYLKQSQSFDPENKYSVPYTFGTVGILYNKTMVDEEITSWSVLWDSKYKDQILMQNSVRDAFGIALKYCGYSLNSTDLDELNEAQELLIRQKPLVQAYVIDQVRDKMISGEAAIGVIYSGEALYTQSENSDLVYVVPDEGSNFWIDSWVIPMNAENKENAEKFLNFLCRADIAKMNFDYITYSTPNAAARELIKDESLRNNPTVFPPQEILDRCETYNYLGTKFDNIYNQMWREIKSK